MSKFLKKTGHKGVMSNHPMIAPMQPKPAMHPSMGLNNTGMASHNNTKAGGTQSVPQGKPHAKVLGTTPTQIGKYL